MSLPKYSSLTTDTINGIIMLSAIQAALERYGVVTEECLDCLISLANPTNNFGEKKIMTLQYNFSKNYGSVYADLLEHGMINKNGEGLEITLAGKNLINDNHKFFRRYSKTFEEILYGIDKGKSVEEYFKTLKKITSQ